MITFSVFLLIGLVVVAARLWAASYKETYSFQCSVTEVADASNSPFVDTSNNDIIHSGLNKGKTVDSAAAVGENVKGLIQGRITLAAGAATLNLAAGPGSAGPTSQNLTGLRVRRMMLRAKSDNANPITVTFGAANGHTGFGAAFSVTLSAGKSALIEGDGATAVAGGNRTLDISGTGTQAIDVMITAGDN